MAKIVHLGKFYFPEVGGIEGATRSLARGAVAAGHQVSVVCFNMSPDCAREELMEGVRVIRSACKLVVFSQPISISYVRRAIQLTARCDLVHVHAPNMLAAFCSLFVVRPTRLVVHWHSDVVNQRFFGWLFKFLQTSMLQRAEVIVGTSWKYVDHSLALAHFRKKVTVIPMGVNPPRNTMYSESALTDLYFRIGRRRVILSVGRLVAYKGFDTLIDAARSISQDAVVVIVGDGPLQSALSARLVREGMEDRVILVGRLSEIELRGLFRRSWVYCLPSTSRAEAFGIVLLEAMSYGLPIISSDIRGSGVSWVNQHGVSGFNVPVGNASALAERCNHILASDALRSTLATGAKQRLLSEFTEEKFIKRVLELYDFVLR